MKHNVNGLNYLRPTVVRLTCWVQFPKFCMLRILLFSVKEMFAEIISLNLQISPTFCRCSLNFTEIYGLEILFLLQISRNIAEKLQFSTSIF